MEPGTTTPPPSRIEALFAAFDARRDALDAVLAENARRLDRLEESLDALLAQTSLDRASLSVGAARPEDSNRSLRFDPPLCY